MKRKILALLLCAAMILTLMPVTAWGEDSNIETGYCGALDADGNPGTNLEYVYDPDAGTVVITGSGEMCNYWGPSSAPWSGDDDVTTVIIGEGVTSIGSYAFDYMYGIKSIQLPSTVTKIGAGAFRACLNMESIQMPDTVQEIGLEAFTYCRSLESFDIPSGIEIIEDAAFEFCTSLTELDIPGNVKTIKEYAFYGCSALTDLTLHIGLETIEDYAFLDCTALKKITLPDTVTQFHGNCINGCMNLLSVNAENGNPVYFSINGILYANKTLTGEDNIHYRDEDGSWLTLVGDTVQLVAFPKNRGGSYTFPEFVQIVDADAFRGCSKLNKVTVPATVIRGQDQFYGCTQLTSAGPLGSGKAIEFEGKVEWLGLKGIPTMQQIILPEETRYMDTIGYYDLETTLDCLYIPRNVIDLGDLLHTTVSDIYYEGSEAEWNALLSQENTDVRENYSKSTMHFNRVPGIYVEPMDFGALEINGSGSAKQWFQLQDRFGSPMKENTTIQYEYLDMGGGPFTLSCDKYGLVGVEFSDQTGTQNKEYRLKFSSPQGESVFNKIQTVTVVMKEASYSQEWSGSVGAGVEGGVGPGVGGEVGPAKVKADLITSTIKLGVKTALSVKDEYV